MNKIIYFHCGLPKTGTKAIQQYLTIKAEDGEGNFLELYTHVANMEYITDTKKMH